MQRGVRWRTSKTLIGVGVSLAVLVASAWVAPESGAAARLAVSAPATGRTHARDAGGAAAGIVPPQNPSESLSPSPNFLSDGSCQHTTLDDSQACNADVVKAIDNARSVLEGMPSLSLNLSAYDAMTVPEQIFVITDLERTDRGLAPVAGLTTQLDTVAQTGATDGTDPELSSSTLTGGATVTSWASIWAGGTANPLGSDYYWMYDDGPGSPNGSCTTPTSPGCWGHRDAILGTFATCGQAEQYMGAGDAATGSGYSPSLAAIVVGACGPTPSDVVFTWAQAESLLGSGTGDTVPGAPRTVTATPSTTKGVVLGWQVPADDGGAAITGYKIFRARSAGAVRFYTTVACTSSTCTFTNRHTRVGTTYFYTVAAVNAEGTGPASAEVSARAH